MTTKERSSRAAGDPAQMSTTHESSSVYNAQVVHVRRCHAELVVIRVQPDQGIRPFQPGQYTVLGLGSWEPRCAGVQAECEDAAPRLIKRAYSISCPLVDDDGHLVRGMELPWYEFYIALVRRKAAGDNQQPSAQRPPALTPRLFCKLPGDRLFCGEHAHGRYTLDGVGADDPVFLLSTGTGEAPHNAMVAELLKRGHRATIANVTCVRFRNDLGYLAAHRSLEQRYPQYRYLALTTREPENVDPTHANYLGRRYLQDYLTSGALESDAGTAIDPARTHVFLCGSPNMIGDRRHPLGTTPAAATTRGMKEVLEERGLRVDLPHRPGNIHLESYW